MNPINNNMNSKSLNVEVNESRLKYLYDFFEIDKLTENQFDFHFNMSGKKKYTNKNLISKSDFKKVSLSLDILKRIDKVFEKGLIWYTLKDAPLKTKDSSIFFRKDNFNTTLNIESKKKINQFEDRKIKINTLCRNIDYNPKRHFKQFSIKDDVLKVIDLVQLSFEDKEKELIKLKTIKKIKDETPKDHLKNLIKIIESFDVFVFEFIDKKKKEELKTNFNGFFMKSNIIVIKRQENIRRELFTLLHEFAHYLLNYEEIDEFVGEDYNADYEIENWCNKFAFYFLLGKNKNIFENLSIANSNNNFLDMEVRNIYSNSYLSYLSIYTQLKIKNKISSSDYVFIKSRLEKEYSQSLFDKKKRLKEDRELEKIQGKKPSPMIPKEIKSSLFEDIVRINFLNGNISESRFNDYLGIDSEKNKMRILSK